MHWDPSSFVTTQLFLPNVHLVTHADKARHVRACFAPVCRAAVRRAEEVNAWTVGCTLRCFRFAVVMEECRLVPADANFCTLSFAEYAPSPLRWWLHRQVTSKALPVVWTLAAETPLCTAPRLQVSNLMAMLGCTRSAASDALLASGCSMQAAGELLLSSVSGSSGGTGKSKTLGGDPCVLDLTDDGRAASGRCGLEGILPAFLTHRQLVPFEPAMRDPAEVSVL